MQNLAHILLTILFLATASLSSYPQQASEPQSEIRHVDSGEVRMMAPESGFYPARQPDIYWHDDKWKIDLLPLSSPRSSYELKILADDGNVKNVVLPENYGQVRAIYRNPDDKAVVIANVSGTVTSFCIVDLKQGKVVDQIAMYSPSVSPNGRFVLYVNGFPPHGSYGENDYRLYDTLKTPRENTCGFRDNDPQHKDLDESYRGFEIYPTIVGRPCLGELPEGQNHQLISSFLWADDSSKAVFADDLNGAITLVLTLMPNAAGDLPQTRTYRLSGPRTICGIECTPQNVKSIAWRGGSVQAVLVPSPAISVPVERVFTIPLSDFKDISQ